LIDSKGINTPFGGLNLIVAGDFAQLPPVGENNYMQMLIHQKQIQHQQVVKRRFLASYSCCQSIK
jgi:ATP-dependent exoDNAse (exonuclease V) alpha subunit